MGKETAIQAMNASDLEFAALCTESVGWTSENYTVFEDFYRHDPQGCFIARIGGEPAGICIATRYRRSGFIGELIVREGMRGHGLGAALLEHAVGYLRNRGIRNIYLDGVLPAVPLYERHRFRKVCRSLRFSGQLAGRQHLQVRAMREEDLPQVCSLDREAFGDDRRFFLQRRLERYPGLCLVQVEEDEIAGYLTGRQGEGYLAAGPGAFSVEGSDPLPLLEAFALQAGERSFSLGVLETNIGAASLLRSLSFVERLDSPWRMALGAETDLGGSPRCLAIGSAATG